jgi:hypothetical protein
MKNWERHIWHPELREYIHALERDRDALYRALDRIVVIDLSTVDSATNAKLLLAISIGYELLAKMEKRKSTTT